MLQVLGVKFDVKQHNICVCGCFLGESQNMFKGIFLKPYVSGILTDVE